MLLLLTVTVHESGTGQLPALRPHAEVWQPVSPFMVFTLAQCKTVLSSAVLCLA